MNIRFVALDPSMSNLGIALGTYESSLNDYMVEEIHLVQTFPPKKIKKVKGVKKVKVRKSSVDYNRCLQLKNGMDNVLNHWAPQVCFVEMPTGSQSSAAMKSYGISIMLIATIGVPIIQVSPNEVKIAAVDSRTASKDTMIKWAVEKWPNLPWLCRKVKGSLELLNKNEHMADACAVIEAAIKTEVWEQFVIGK